MLRVVAVFVCQLALALTPTTFQLPLPPIILSFKNLHCLHGKSSTHLHERS